MKRVVVAAVLVGAVMTLAVVVQANTVMVTTPNQLVGIINSACMQAVRIQTESQIICQQIKAELIQQLRQQLTQQGHIAVDPNFLGETIVWMYTWQHRYIASWQEKAALQLVLQLMKMHQHGVSATVIQGLVEQAEQSGYTTSDAEYMCTRLQEMMGATLDDVVKAAIACLKTNVGTNVDDIIAAVHQRVHAHTGGNKSGNSDKNGNCSGGKQSTNMNKSNAGSGNGTANGTNNGKKNASAPHQKHGHGNK